MVIYLRHKKYLLYVVVVAVIPSEILRHSCNLFFDICCFFLVYKQLEEQRVTKIMQSHSFCSVFFCSREGLALGRQAGRWAGGRVIYRCRRPPDGKRERIRRKEYVVCSTCNIDFIFFSGNGRGFEPRPRYIRCTRGCGLAGIFFYVKWHQKNDTYSSFSIFENFSVYLFVFFVCVFFLKK